MKPLQHNLRSSRKNYKAKSYCNGRKTLSVIQLLRELDDINPFPKCSLPTIAKLAFRAYIYGKWLLQGLGILKGSKKIGSHGCFCKAALLGYDDCRQKRRLNEDRITEGVPKTCVMIPVRASIWQEKMNRRSSLEVIGKHNNSSGLQKSESHHPTISHNFERGNPFLGMSSTNVYASSPMHEEPDSKLKSEMLPFHPNFSSSPKMDVLSSKISLNSSPQFGTMSPEQNVKQIFTNEELWSFERIMGSPTLHAPIYAFQECHDVYSSTSSKVADISVSPWKTDTPNLYSPICSSVAVE